MSKVRQGREVARRLVEAMGLPVEGASAVYVDLPVDGFATVQVTYPLTAEALALLSEAMKPEL